MTFQKTTPLPCSLEEAFAFHTDIQNLPKLSPPDTHVQIQNEVTSFEKGTRIVLKAQKGYRAMTWEVEVSEFNPPYSFTDVAIKSPFKSWSHTHSFFQKEGTTYMQDSIECTLPFGFIGKLFESYVKKELETMFAYRHKAIVELL